MLTTRASTCRANSFEYDLQNQRKQTPSSNLDKMENVEDNQKLVQVGTTKLDSALAKTRSSKEGSPRQKRVTIMAVKEPPSSNDKWLEEQEALHRQKELELRQKQEELERKRREQEEMQKQLDLQRQQQELEYKRLQEIEKQRQTEFLKQKEELERQEREKQQLFDKEQEMKRQLELKAQQERDTKIREEQLREQRLRENQAKLQIQQNERNVPIQYTGQTNLISSSPLPPPRPITPDEVRNSMNQYRNQQPVFQAPVPPKSMAPNPVFPSPSLGNNIVPDLSPFPNSSLTIDPFARNSTMSANTKIPDDAFRNRGRQTIDPPLLSPTGGRERTIPIKIETHKYTDVSHNINRK